jgi:DNA (cytosine-5)-methyltransferase 1
MLTFGSLFAGIGGFDLGLERAGMKCLWQVENNEYCNRVLEKHWPEVRRYGDIKAIREGELGYVDVICGGFPCQDISKAGRQAGLKGEKSSLWFEMLRVIRMVKPKYAIVENVPALSYIGLDTVLAGLASCGYNAEWNCIPACAVGAHHRRDRLFIIAYTDDRRAQCEIQAGRNAFKSCSMDVAYSPGIRRGEMPERQPDARGTDRTAQDIQERQKANMAHSDSARLQARFFGADKARTLERCCLRNQGSQWKAEPDVGRVVAGLPFRVDRLKCIGNSVVPQVAEFIGKIIVDFEG